MEIELAGGASTNSRANRPLPSGAVRGTTCAVMGARELVQFEFEDGHSEERELLSWVGGQAGLLWGGGPYPRPIQQAISEDSVPGSYGHKAEYDLADELGQVFDGYLSSDDMAVRFFSNGGDACAAAVRVARAVTCIDTIGTQGYHGSQTDFGHQPAWAGYPYENVMRHMRFEFGDVKGMIDVAARSGCLMVEVPAWDDEEEIGVFLRRCREEADFYHIPFIIDDVVCGFRLALAGTAARYGVKPDMVCMGKAMSATGGISALIGRRDLVGKLGDGSVFYSTTFGGTPDRCAVAAATVKWLREHEIEVYGGDKLGGERQEDGTWVHRSLSSKGHLRTIGHALKDGLIKLGVTVVGQPERSALAFPNDADWLNFCRLVIDQGVMLHRPQFPTLAHTLDDVDVTLRAVERALLVEKVG